MRTDENDRTETKPFSNCQYQVCDSIVMMKLTHIDSVMTAKQWHGIFLTLSESLNHETKNIMHYRNNRRIGYFMDRKLFFMDI